MAEFESLQGAYFAFEMGGMKIGYFTECSGLSSEVNVIEQPQTSDGGKKIVAKQPGPERTYSEVVLKRGFTSDRALNDWYDKTVDAGEKVDRKEGSIVMTTTRARRSHASTSTRHGRRSSACRISMPRAARRWSRN